MNSIKKIAFGIAGAAVIAVLILAVIWGRQYYHDRYASSDYYAMVPIDTDITPVDHYSDNHDYMGLAVDYELTAYDANGVNRDLKITVYAPESPFSRSGEPIIEPGTYLQIQASATIVTGWKIINKNEIPEKVLVKISEG